MKEQEINKTKKKAFDNYSSSEPWPKDDTWHFYTNKILSQKVQEILDKYNSDCKIILNAGCGKTTYRTSAKIIYMDIIEKYVEKFPNHIVGSIENIPLEDSTIDCIICVGSVINYTDVQRVLSEFSRVLKDGGKIILEFERSNSAEFLFTSCYGKTVFRQEYLYNNQQHFLWMYNERFVISLAGFYNLHCIKTYRFHIFSSLLYRFGIIEEKAAKYCCFDSILQPIGYPFSHNTILTFTKTTPL